MIGIDERKNKNGFAVLQVHYTADPEKDPARDGAEWFRKSNEGMPEASWRKEYEIDFFALSGELIFPGFDRSVHLVEPFEIPSLWTRYMAVDPGLRNPTGVLWCAVDPDETIWFYDEHYEAGKVVSEHAEIIKEKEKKYFKIEMTEREKRNLGEGSILVRLIDPSAQNRSIITKRSISDEYKKHGIFCIPANNDFDAGVERVNNYLKVDEKTKKPKILFFRNLVNLINEITKYRWKIITEEKILLVSPPETAQSVDDHLMDCLRYILMADPHFVKPHRMPVFKRKTDPTGYY